MLRFRSAGGLDFTSGCDIDTFSLRLRRRRRRRFAIHPLLTQQICQTRLCGCRLYILVVAMREWSENGTKNTWAVTVEVLKVAQARIRARSPGAQQKRRIAAPR